MQVPAASGATLSYQHYRLGSLDSDMRLDVRLWHLADMSNAPTNARFWGQNGHGAELSLCPLMTQADISSVSGVSKTLADFDLRKVPH